MIAGLLCIGLILIASALKGTEHELGGQVQSDILGAQGFLAWAGAILAIGAIGYIPTLKTASRSLLLLLGVVMVVRNGGVWSQAQQAFQQASASGPAPSVPVLTSSSSGSSGSSGGSSGGLDAGTVVGAIGGALSIFG